MPHAYWSGFLRLSLVSCPIYLSPATTERERITLHQINPETGNRIRLQPVDAETGAPLERANLIRGYEVEKGHYVEIKKEELDSLKIESTRVLELSRFVERKSINPLFLDSHYYVYPENQQAEEAYEVIAAALAKAQQVGIGRIVVSQRERPVALQPFEGGLLMSTLRTAEEVRAAEFPEPEKELDPQMVDLAITIVERLAGKFEPERFHDRYQDALKELIEAKQKGEPIRKPRFEEPGKVVDLMAVLRKSLQSTTGKEPPDAEEQAEETEATEKRRPQRKTRAAKTDRRQRALLLPIENHGKEEEQPRQEKAAPKRGQEAAPAPRSRRKHG